MDTQPKRRTRFFYHKLGRDGVDDTFDIVSVMTGNVVASFPFWNESPEDEERTRIEADKLVDGLNALIGFGGRLRGGNLEAAIPESKWTLVTASGEPLEPAEPCWTETPIEGSRWTVEDVLTVRPDLHREEACGVLREIAMLANFGTHIRQDIVQAIADETFSVIEPIVAVN